MISLNIAYQVRITTIQFNNKYSVLKLSSIICKYNKASDYMILCHLENLFYFNTFTSIFYSQLCKTNYLIIFVGLLYIFSFQFQLTNKHFSPFYNDDYDSLNCIINGGSNM